jgi:hypothetical protein
MIPSTRYPSTRGAQLDAVAHQGHSPSKHGALCAVLILGLLGSAAGYAQSDPAHGGGARGAVGGAAHGQVFDNRYNHGYYYPQRGAAVATLPSGYRPYYFHGHPYYFYGGVWYAPGPFGFVVVSAPVGLFLSVLPPYYTTVWFDGIPYYYADDTYYQWQPDMNGYAVVAPPPNAEQPGTAPQAPTTGTPADNLYMYPKNGQDASQQAADRYECRAWAVSQTGFDPTRTSGLTPDQIASKSSQFGRAMSACLEARGYSVK